jgi:hypothetical protein
MNEINMGILCKMMSAAQSAKNSTDALDEVFGKLVVNQGLWPLQSPDLNQCDFYL